jgi:hypothetical protein
LHRIEKRSFGCAFFLAEYRRAFAITNLVLSAVSVRTAFIMGDRKMPATRQCALLAILILVVVIFVRPAAGQVSSSAALDQATQSSQSPSVPTAVQESAGNARPSPLAPAMQTLLDFRDADIKFNLQNLMSILKDRNHEGWVLAAYPDPQTSRPLIGAGFGLDVTATEHAQMDPLNPHPFIEPSSGELWQAAGLDPDRLQTILDRFHSNLETWGTKGYRRKIRTHSLSSEVTEGDATKLLRISVIEAVQNAKAYCRSFDQLTAAQQMALSQLVFQMGVNLEEFVQFLSVLNEGGDSGSGVQQSAEHWNAVERALIESQWARRYASRAASVIAMFDPEYAQDPAAVERRVAAVVRPPSRHRRGRRQGAVVRTASVHHGNQQAKKKYKRKVT